MPSVVLASAVARWLSPDPAVGVGERKFSIDGATVRGYLTDERGVLRHHVVVFVNGAAVTDKRTLAEPVPTDGEVYVFQALSGG
jgi:sulfur carrier protein ThiS